MSALHPPPMTCPICNHPTMAIGKGAGRYAITCTDADCQTEGPTRFSIAAAIAAWNRRAGDDEVEKLREALRLAANALDVARMPHSAASARTAIGDTP